MTTNPSMDELFRQSLSAAKRALRAGDRWTARKHARQAVRANPRSEKAWLILAGVSEPRAGLAYAARALEINPRSESARQAIRYLARSVPAQDRRAALREASIPEGLLPDMVPGSHIAQRRVLPVRVLLASLVLAGAVGLHIGRKPAAALQPQTAGNPLEKATMTATPTPTSTPTPTPTATPTITLTPTATFTPTATPTRQVSYLSSYSISMEEIYAEGRWIEIDISEQRVSAYEGDRQVNSFTVSTGTSAHPTVLGQYRVYVKLSATDMSGPGYYLPDVPYTMYFYRGYALHGTYWHSNFGTPMSHGCVNLRTADSEWLFNFASVGTLVYVHP
ncbi:MAG: L,D-transpeptidase family protein [Anaerolineales bacterium]|nr:L,D-transpeptidase family protein [Anaerolineales bacterium]